MNWLENIRIALRGIAANKLRSALTVLGILIGVGAVIILVAVGAGSSKSIQDRIQNLGTNTITVSSQGRFGRRGGGSRTGTQSRATQLTLGDAKALQDPQSTPDVRSVSPVVQANATATHAGNTYTVNQIIGTTPSYFSAANDKVAQGTALTDDDVTSRSRVLVIGQTLVTNLFPGQDPVGQQVKLGSASYEVVGVLQAKGTNGLQDLDAVAIAPYTAVQDTLAGSQTVNSITIQGRSAKTLDLAQAEVQTVLDSRHPVSASATSPFQILNQGSLLATSESTTRTFTILLGAVAAISLLVGGIGVMNIMLVTVTERTREIGIRKAIGAPRSVILGQFLIEAVLLSVIGGVVGVATGIVGSRFRIVGVQPVVAPSSILLAFGVAVVVGIFFGLYPANRAASLRPIDALRYE